MTLSLCSAWLALRSGLEIRRRRARRQPGVVELRSRHLRFAKPAVVLILIGAFAGPLSSWLLRDWTPFQTLHAWAGVTAFGAFAATGILGRRLERGLAVARPIHARLALIAALAAGLAAVSGFVLLP